MVVQQGRLCKVLFLKSMCRYRKQNKTTMCSLKKSLSWPSFEALARDWSVPLFENLSPHPNHLLYLGHDCCFVAKSCYTLCDPMDCSLPGSLCPWDFPGKNTGVGCCFLLQGIFSTQGSNPSLLHWQADSLLMSHQGSPIDSWVKDSTCCILICFSCVWLFVTLAL